MGLYSLLYDIGLGVYHAGIKFSSLYNNKAKQWVAGRIDWQNHLTAKLDGRPVVWVHCASLGEYEQGLSLINTIEQEQPDKQVLVSFYSPSGYEVIKRKEPKRSIIYLPPDTEGNAKQFLQIVNPVLAVFIKYEFWYHYLQYLRWQKVPTILVSGIFRQSQPFFQPWGGLHSEMLACFTHFFVQDDDSRVLLQGLGLANVTVGGDTRFDRVVAIQKSPQSLPVVEQFKSDAPIFIAGSIWPADEAVLLPLLPELIAKGWKVVLAPHEINNQDITQLKDRIGETATTYTEQAAGKDIMIVDNVGMLAHMYQYAELAYIGGGFGKGIHNTLEAAANALPVIFGPNYQKFKEAKELKQLGGAFSISSVEELQKCLEGLLNENEYISSSQAALNYVNHNVGATVKVMQWIRQTGL